MYNYWSDLLLKHFGKKSNCSTFKQLLLLPQYFQKHSAAVTSPWWKGKCFVGDWKLMKALKIIDYLISHKWVICFGSIRDNNIKMRLFTRKTALWPLRRLIWRHIRLRRIKVLSNDSRNRKSTGGDKCLLAGMLRLIQVDTLRRDHNVGFLVERLKRKLSLEFESQLS